jgi:hypothetical protein
LYRDEQYIKGTRGGVYEHGAQIVENVQTDTAKSVDSIWGPHNSDGEDSSLKRMKTCGSFIGNNVWEEFAASIFRVFPWP